MPETRTDKAVKVINLTTEVFGIFIIVLFVSYLIGRYLCR
jgi:hypothetical protein